MGAKIQRLDVRVHSLCRKEQCLGWSDKQHLQNVQITHDLHGEHTVNELDEQNHIALGDQARLHRRTAGSSGCVCIQELEAMN